MYVTELLYSMGEAGFGDALDTVGNVQVMTEI